MMAGKPPFHNPFAQLKQLRGDRPDAPPLAPAPPAPPAAPEPAQRSTGPSIPRAVVRLERTGRGGKEVTVIEHLAVPPMEREKWLKALKGALGCGGVVEGDALVLQGDQRTRVPKLLAARGVKKVTVA
jgi:translation initiation factor 1